MLPGGGDLTSRIWAGIRLHTKSRAKWCVNRAFDTPAFLDAKRLLENICFLDEGSPNLIASIQAWKITSVLEKLQARCEIFFLCEATHSHHDYDAAQLMDLLSGVTRRAVKEGKAKAKSAHEDSIATAFVWGGGHGT